MTTKSIWSSSHDGRLPSISPTPNLSLSDFASSDQLSSGFLSCSATTAPRSAKNLADAMPDFPAPRTKVFLPESSIFSCQWLVVSARLNQIFYLTTDHSSKLQRRKTQKRKKYRGNHEPENDFRFFPAGELKVMMQR